MKCLKKERLLTMSNGVEQVFNERNLLANLNHPFICNIHYAFQDESNLYIVMDVMLGGDLRYQLNHAPERCLSEDQTKVRKMSYFHLILNIFFFFFLFLKERLNEYNAFKNKKSTPSECISELRQQFEFNTFDVNFKKEFSFFFKIKIFFSFIRLKQW